MLWVVEVVMVQELHWESVLMLREAGLFWDIFLLLRLLCGLLWRKRSPLLIVEVKLVRSHSLDEENGNGGTKIGCHSSTALHICEKRRARCRSKSRAAGQSRGENR